MTAKLKFNRQEIRPMNMKNKKINGLFLNLYFPILAGALLFLSACAVGPKYQRPTAPVPAAYKEAPPANAQEASDWKPSQPSDSAAKGKWWEVYHDPALNALEDQVSVSNQNILAAEAQYREARDAVRIARSGLFP